MYFGVFVAHSKKQVLRIGMSTICAIPAHRCYSSKGVHPRVVIDILDHSLIDLSMNTYSHVAPQLQQDAAQRMDSMFTGDGVDRDQVSHDTL